jgi:hypothetical protein
LKNENKNDFLINRTNNPLERYNRRLNDAFSSPHPTMSQFVETLKNEASFYVDKLERIKKRKEKPAFHKEVTVFPIPLDYHKFKPKQMKK